MVYLVYQMFINSIIDSVDMNLSDLWEIVKDKEAWHDAVNGVAKIQTVYRLNNNKILDL